MGCEPKFRKNHPDLARRNKFLCENHLTEEKLKSFLARTEAHEKAYPKHEDDIYQTTIDGISTLEEMLLNAPVGFPNAFSDVAAQANTLRKMLESQSNPRQRGVRDWLNLCVKEVLCDNGQPLSQGVFTARTRRAQRLREEWRQLGELRNLARALYREAEFNRLHFLVNPDQEQFLVKARAQLDSAIYLCDLAIDRYKGEQKRTANFLAFYGELGKAQLVFNVGKPDQAAQIIQSIQKRAKAVSDAYSTGEIVATIRFLFSITQAEYHMKLHQIDSAYRYVIEAEKILSPVQSSVEEDINIAYIRAGLALEEGGQGDHEDVQQFIQLLRRYPFLTYRKQLLDLQDTYPGAFPEVSLPRGNDLFIESRSMFGHTKHIHKYVLSV